MSVADVSYTKEEAKGADAALAALKDWSNYLLITTAGLLAWVGEHTQQSHCRTASIGLLCFSVVFGIFTLALVPLVRENIARAPVKGADSNPESIYDVKPEFRLFFGDSCMIKKLRIKHVCWPQHAAFILGVVFYSIASITTPKVSENRAPVATSGQNQTLGIRETAGIRHVLSDFCGY
jgi:hypothetical protein